MADSYYSLNDGSASASAILSSSTGLVLFTNSAQLSRSGSARNNAGLFVLVLGLVNTAPTIYSWNGDGTFNLVGTFAAGTVNPTACAFSSVLANFWCLSGIAGANFNTPSFRKFDSTGAILNTVGPITFIANGIQTLAVSLDETIGYYTGGVGNNQPIKRWDLVGNVALGDLVANLGDTNAFVQHLYPITGSTDIVAVIQSWDGTAGHSNTRIIRRYTAAGAIVYSVTFAKQLTPGDFRAECSESSSLTTIVCRWGGPTAYNISTGSRFQVLNLSDGSTAGFVDNVADVVTFIPAGTCPMVVLGVSAPPATGT